MDGWTDGLRYGWTDEPTETDGSTEMDLSTDGPRTDGRTNGLMDGRTNERTDGRTSDGRTYVRIYGRTITDERSAY